MKWRVLLVVLLLSACQDASVPDSALDMVDAAFVDDDGFKGCPDSSPPVTLGLRAVGDAGVITASLVAASNVPARRYLNDWTLAFRSSADASIDDIVVTQARTFMPLHGHDGIVPPQVETMVVPGQRRIDGLNFNMRGPWEVQLSLSSASVGHDYVVFSICVAE